MIPKIFYFALALPLMAAASAPKASEKPVASSAQTKADLGVKMAATCKSNLQMSVKLNNTTSIEIATIAVGASTEQSKPLMKISAGFASLAKHDSDTIKSVDKAFSENILKPAKDAGLDTDKLMSDRDDLLKELNRKMIVSYSSSMNDQSKAVDFVMKIDKKNNECSEFFKALTGAPDDTDEDDTTEG